MRPDKAYIINESNDMINSTFHVDLRKSLFSEATVLQKNLFLFLIAQNANNFRVNLSQK